MSDYTNNKIIAIRNELFETIEHLENKGDILKHPKFKQIYANIKDLPADERKIYGQEANALKLELEKLVEDNQPLKDKLEPIDVTAPFTPNTPVHERPNILRANQGSIHPLMRELDKIIDIYSRLGFTSIESREIDDDYHMFTSLNFPTGHPARDDYDTFMTTEGLIAPAHTSTMQNRALKMFRSNLAKGEPIAVVIPGRVFRNEDLDVTHEHTFYQLEGVFVAENINVGNLIAVLQSFMNEYFGQNLKAKIQPFYFPFTEPSFEFAIERPDALKKGRAEADQWLELLGCGLIHPEVLRQADIDSNKYTGFAWGGGIERLVLMKNNIEDIRHFESGKLDFLRQFK